MKRFILSILLLFLTVSVLDAQNLTEEELAAQRKIIEANKHFLLEDYAKAKDAYADILGNTPKSSAALYGMARVAEAEKDYPTAEKFIRLAILEESDNQWYLRQLVDIEKRQKDMEGMTEAYEQLLALDPESEEYRFELTNCYEKTGKYKAALKVLDGIRVSGVDPAVSYRRARIFVKMKKMSKAESEYQNLIDAYPTEKRYLHIMADHYRATGETEKAMNMYEKVLELDPDDSRAGLALANDARSRGSDLVYLDGIKKIISSPAIDPHIKVKELLPFVQKISQEPNPDVQDRLDEYADLLIDLHRGDAKVYALRADLYNLRDDRPNAIRMYEFSLTHRKTVYSVWEQYLYLLLEEGQNETLIQKVQGALDYFPNRGRLYFLEGMAYSNLRQYEKAERSLMQSAMMAGRDVQLNFETQALLGTVAHNLGKWDMSDRSFQNAINILPNHVGVLSSWAYFLAEREQDMSKALMMARKAYESSGENASAAMSYAWVLARMGETDSALGIMQSTSEETGGKRFLEVYGDVLFLSGAVDQAVEKWSQALELAPADKTLADKIRNRSIIK